MQNPEITKIIIFDEIQYIMMKSNTYIIKRRFSFSLKARIRGWYDAAGQRGGIRDFSQKKLACLKTLM